MGKDGKDHGAYADRVREDTLKYAQELLGENEKLRAFARTLEADQQRLQAEVAALRDELTGQRRDQERLKGDLAVIEKENRHFSEGYVEVERRNSNLAQLYGASYRLHGTLDRRDVLTVIREIIANLVGSEQIAIFAVTPDGTALTLEDAVGVEVPFPDIPLGAGCIGRCAREGEICVPGRDDRLPHEADLSACIPLMLDGEATGAIAIFRLLPQKPGIEDLDREIFELLATHAATALYCATLHARVAAGFGG